MDSSNGEAGNGRLTLCVLGRFSVQNGGGSVEVPSACQRVLAVLAVGGGTADRHRLAGTVWPDRPDERALANLRAALWRLPGQLRSSVDRLADRIRLGASWAVDLDEAVATAASLRAGSLDSRSEGSSRALLAADLLPDWDMDCLVVARERHRQLRLHALEDLADLQLRAGRPLDAVDTALAAIVAEPLRETAQELLLRAHVAAGNRSEAVRAYDRFCRLLSTELGLDPGPGLRAALARAMAQS